MKKVYIVCKGDVEGIQDIRSVHLTKSGALSAWKKLCDEMIKQAENMIDYELENSDHDRWIRRYGDNIDALRTYDPEIVSDKLYPSEAPIIIETELKP